ncbi:hypothetical protein CMV_030784, partial [Castanea mollissima]
MRTVLIPSPTSSPNKLILYASLSDSEAQFGSSCLCVALPICQETMEGDRKISTTQDGLGDASQKMRALQGRTSGPTRRSTKGQWTPEEDEILQKAVQRYKGKNWKKI